jgi:hypothetical protein
MPPLRSALADIADPSVPPQSSAPPPKWEDIDRLENSDRIVTVFSQRSWDGKITFAFHRLFDRYDDHGKPETSKTNFIPEELVPSFLAHLELSIRHLEVLKSKRAAGKLAFPEGGLVKRARR